MDQAPPLLWTPAVRESEPDLGKKRSKRDRGFAKSSN
jgi:hypothetical protein